MDRRRVGRVAGVWTLVALGAGTTQWVAYRVMVPDLSWVEGAAGPFAAALLWIPLTLAALELAERFPPVRPDPWRVRGRALAGHALAAVLTTFLINGVFALFGAWPDPAEGWLVASFVHLPLNAPAWMVIVLGASVLPQLGAERGAEGLAEGAEAEVVPGGGGADETEHLRSGTLTVRSGSAQVVVRVEDVLWIEGAGDYVRIHTDSTSHLHAARLKQLETLLPEPRFVRVHRSAIVNVDAVVRLTSIGHGDREAELSSGARVRVSRTRRGRLDDVMRSRDLERAAG